MEVNRQPTDDRTYYSVGGRGVIAATLRCPRRRQGLCNPPPITGPKHTPPLRHGWPWILGFACWFARASNAVCTAEICVGGGPWRRRFSRSTSNFETVDPPRKICSAWRMPSLQPSSTWGLQDQRSSKPVLVVDAGWKPRMCAAVSVSQDCLRVIAENNSTAWRMWEPAVLMCCCDDARQAVC